MTTKGKILRVWTETAVDTDPDTSWIGEFTDKLEPGVIVRELGEYVERLPEDAEIPGRGQEYRGFKPYAGGEPVGSADYYKYGLQDWKRMASLCRGDWFFLGIIAKAEVQMGKDTPIQTLRSGGLWGIESDSGAYIDEVKREELHGLRTELEAVGFGKRAIDYAFTHVDTKEK